MIPVCVGIIKGISKKLPKNLEMSSCTILKFTFLIYFEMLYNNNVHLSTGTEADLPRPMSSDSSSTVAIAIGLGVGLSVSLTVVILFGWGFYYIRTRKRKNGERDKVEVKLQVLNSSPRQELKANQGSVTSLSGLVGRADFLPFSLQ